VTRVARVLHLGFCYDQLHGLNRRPNAPNIFLQLITAPETVAQPKADCTSCCSVCAALLNNHRVIVACIDEHGHGSGVGVVVVVVGIRTFCLMSEESFHNVTNRLISHRSRRYRHIESNSRRSWRI